MKAKRQTEVVFNSATMLDGFGGHVITTYTNDAAGNLISTVLPNRALSTYTYDTVNRLLSVTNSSLNSILSGFTYKLDKVGNRIQVTSTGGKVTQYGYDALYRLTSWTTPSGVVTQYVYDAGGNRTVLITPMGTTSYTYDAADELLSAGATTFTYDGNGNQITKTTGGSATNYAWDALNRLISVTGGGINTQYAYDSDGNRVSQQIPSGIYQYVNDAVAALPTVLDETGPDGAIDYSRGLSLLSESFGPQQDFYQFDGLGSVTTVTNSAGAHQANYGYDPWGQLINPVDPPIGLDAVGTKNKYRFTAEALDGSVGLVYLRSRYYDPSTGRFISRDPLSGSLKVPKTQNRYQYALSDPVCLVDLSGNEAIDGNSTTGGVLGASTVRFGGSSWLDVTLNWVRTIVGSIPNIVQVLNEGPTTTASATDPAHAVLEDTPELAATFAQSDIQVMDSQKALIDNYAGLVRENFYTVDQAVAEIRADNYLPGFTQDKIRYLLNQDIQRLNQGGQ